jgi:tRNA threonylcarbamoyladenosine biosynthesis protein TsaB
MALILVIDTCTLQCSVALSKDGTCLASQHVREDGYVHAERLMPMVDDVLREAGHTAKDLDACAVAGGPGSFTGLRIGVSAAKGLCQGLNIPLIALDPLALLARQGQRLDDSPVQRVPMIDARRMEVYTASFNASLERTSPVAPWVLDEDVDSWDDNAQFIGDGALAIFPVEAMGVEGARRAARGPRVPRWKKGADDGDDDDDDDTVAPSAR